MKNIYEFTTMIEPHDTLFNLDYSIVGIFRHFQVAATNHVELLGASSSRLLECDNAIWVISKVKVEIAHTPKWYENITVKTNPIKPTLAKCERDCVFSQDGNEIIQLRSEWCILDKNTYHIRRPSTIKSYPNEMEHRIERAKVAEYERFSIEVEEADLKYTHRVRVSDLDMNAHTNNVTYVRLSIDAFGASEFANRKLRGYEIAYKSQSFEGDELNIYRKDENNASYVVGKKKDGTLVFECKLEFAMMNMDAI